MPKEISELMQEIDEAREEIYKLSLQFKYCTDNPTKVRKLAEQIAELTKPT